MSRPTLGVEIDFSNGASFGYPLILNDPNFGLLDESILGDAPADIVDVTSQVMKVSTRRGRNRILSNFEAGTATVVLNDPNSNFNPQNENSAYWDPVTDSTKVLPLRKIRIWADQDRGDGVIQRFYMFSGYITSYDTGFYQGVDSTSTVTLQCVDGFRLLANVSTDLPPVPGCTAGQLSGARVNALLDYADWPNSLRNIDTGDSTMMADPGGNRSVLAAIQTIEQSEFGAFYIQPSGIARFLDRTDVSELADSGVRVFSDNPAIFTGSLPYVNLDSAFDDQLILNDVTVTRYNDGTIPAPVPQTIIDQDSVDKYFYKSGQRSDILVQTDSEANDQARTLVAARKNADLRIDSMTLTLNTDDNALNVAGLTTDIYRLVYIYKTMSNASAIQKELFVQGVQHDVTPKSWTTKFFTQEPIIQAFILDSSTQGLLADVEESTIYSNALSY
jgi:hypothetical protein